jgi:hypothetical protein
MIVIGLTGRLSDRRSCVMAIRVWRLFGGFSGRVRWIHAVGSAAAMIFPGRCSGRDGAELGEVRVEWSKWTGRERPVRAIGSGNGEACRLGVAWSLGAAAWSLLPPGAAGRLLLLVLPMLNNRHAQHNAPPRYAPQCTQCTDAEPTPPLPSTSTNRRRRTTSPALPTRPPLMYQPRPSSLYA